MNIKFPRKATTLLAVCLLIISALSGCDEQSSFKRNNNTVINDEQPIWNNAANISRLIPARVKDRLIWAQDINRIMDDLKIVKNKENICSVIAVIDQESNFVANPAVPGLGKKAINAFQK